MKTTLVIIFIALCIIGYTLLTITASSKSVLPITPRGLPVMTNSQDLTPWTPTVPNPIFNYNPQTVSTTKVNNLNPMTPASYSNTSTMSCLKFMSGEICR